MELCEENSFRLSLNEVDCTRCEDLDDNSPLERRIKLGCDLPEEEEIPEEPEEPEVPEEPEEPVIPEEPEEPEEPVEPEEP